MLMAGVCLPPQLVDKVKAGFTSGKLDPFKMAAMTSEERHALLADVVGEGNAKWVNAEFEAKTLLKNQQRGYITWASKITGMSPAAKRDIISRIQKMDRVLNPTEEKAFLKDLAEKKLGVGVDVTEAKQIANMSKQLTELEAKRSPSGAFPDETTRMAYGRAKADMGNYLGDLKRAANKMSAGQYLSHPVQAVTKVAGFQKSIQAAFDDSALFRQNFKTLLTHPGLWAKNAMKNIADLKKAGINNQDIMREATADVLSRPYAEKYYKNMGIAPKVEEEFGDPTLVTKIPLIGRIYKTTEMAFNAVMLRTRADLADYYIDLAKTINGEDVPKGSMFRDMALAVDSKLKLVKAVNIDNKEQQQALGRMIGGITGRGDLGSLEKAASSFNNVFFSPRFVKSQIDTVMHPFNGAGGMHGNASNFVRQEAAKNLIKIVGGTAAIFAAANAIHPGSVELDPRSSKFGKIKVGDTTFDVTGGFGSIAILAARIIKQQYKSGSKGTITTLGSNPTAPTGDKLVMQFIQGKLSPGAQRAWADLVTHQEFNGAKPSVKSNLYNGLVPLPAQTYLEAKQDPHGANALVTEAMDALGISANTSNPAQQVKPLSATDQALKTKIGAKQFSDYQTSYNDKLTSFLSSDFYKGLPNDQKQAAYLHAEDRIKKNLYKQYDFKPPKAASNKDFNKSVDAVVGG